jgi:oligopeptide/dipeptide ABC transporter ATP-binding protein
MLGDDLLTVGNLKVYYNTESGVIGAVDGVNLVIKPKQKVGLVGESGCGKSTLARAIIRLLPPVARIVSGSIIFKGKDLARIPEKDVRKIRGREISMIFQDPMSFLNPVMKIGDQIAEVISHRRADRRKAYERGLELLEKVGIPRSRNLMEDYPHQLSGGLRQRVLLALAVSSDPSLLIADEATTAVDATVQAQILELISELAGNMGSSVLLITHDLGIVAQTCDEVYVMYAGRVAEHANVRTIFRSPKHPYAQALMASALSVEEYKEELMGVPGEVPNLMNPPPGCRFHPRCSFAMQVCREREPVMTDLDFNHEVSCWKCVEGVA